MPQHQPPSSLCSQRSSVLSSEGCLTNHSRMGTFETITCRCSAVPLTSGRSCATYGKVRHCPKVPFPLPSNQSFSGCVYLEGLDYRCIEDF